MSCTRISRVANYDPLKYWIAIIILCAANWIMIFSTWVNSKKLENQERQISGLQMDTLLLKDALKIKTSIVAKEDSAYWYWVGHPELRVFVKNQMLKTK